MVFSLVSVPEIASAYTFTEEDLKFDAWCWDNRATMEIYDELILAALKDHDYDALERWYGKEYVFYKESLEEIEQFDVSPVMQPIKNEYKLALQDYKKAVYYGVRWAKYHHSDDADKCVSYSESGTEHMNKVATLIEVAALIEEFVSESEFTTPSLTPQVEKDSDGDGVPDKYDYAPNDPKVQTKEDVKTPGFGVVFAIGSLLSVAYLTLSNKCYFKRRK